MILLSHLNWDVEGSWANYLKTNIKWNEYKVLAGYKILLLAKNFM